MAEFTPIKKYVGRKEVVEYGIYDRSQNAWLTLGADKLFRSGGYSPCRPIFGEEGTQEKVAAIMDDLAKAAVGEPSKYRHYTGPSRFYELEIRSFNRMKDVEENTGLEGRTIRSDNYAVEVEIRGPKDLVDNYVESFFAQYHPCGYGSTRRVIEETETHKTVSLYRYRSCD